MIKPIILSILTLLTVLTSEAQSYEFELVKAYTCNKSNRSIENVKSFNGSLYFTTSCRGFLDAVETLWKSDGTLQGTFALKTFSFNGPVGLNKFTICNGQLFFIANDGTTGNELWKTDGTVNGTILVKDIFPGNNFIGPNSSNPSEFVVLNNTLFFRARSASFGDELWKSDGTALGTVLVKDIEIGTANSFPSNLTVYNNHIYFSATTSAFGTELWQSDGNEVGTVLLKDIETGSSSSSIDEVTASGNLLFFSCFQQGVGYELWKSDGTELGTVLVNDINLGTESSTPTNLIDLNGTLFFTAYTTDFGNELWKSDGTNAGTVLVKEIKSGGLGNGGSYPSELTKVGSVLFFTAQDDVHGIELWKTDGTSLNTNLVKDILPGLGGSMPQFLTSINGKLYFSGNDNVFGDEPWISDGTDDGTKMIGDLTVGSNGSNCRNFTEFNGQVFFTTLFDLWKIIVLENNCAENINLSSSNNPSDDIVNQTTVVQANSLTGQITATNKIIGSSNATFEAGKSIVLNEGFIAESGVVFLAQIGGCN